ncbi:hypothetical protein CDAR_171801 [Caerostris darwini]|uniref:Uncharacterized protein n=1 Tax=Caerostris darwini TaxID=1538125 RepID=A0AAV4MMQ8_9ARAC|nr:hypothetical protein CDAR_171801 [Caerostris darwini]
MTYYDPSISHKNAGHCKIWLQNKNSNITLQHSELEFKSCICHEIFYPDLEKFARPCPFEWEQHKHLFVGLAVSDRSRRLSRNICFNSFGCRPTLCATVKNR